jgi:hypothetical protein
LERRPKEDRKRRETWRRKEKNIPLMNLRMRKSQTAKRLKKSCPKKMKRKIIKKNPTRKRPKEVIKKVKKTYDLIILSLKEYFIK